MDDVSQVLFGVDLIHMHVVLRFLRLLYDQIHVAYHFELLLSADGQLLLLEDVLVHEVDMLVVPPRAEYHEGKEVFLFFANRFVGHFVSVYYFFVAH